MVGYLKEECVTARGICGMKKKKRRGPKWEPTRLMKGERLSGTLTLQPYLLYFICSSLPYPQALEKKKERKRKIP